MCVWERERASEQWWYMYLIRRSTVFILTILAISQAGEEVLAVGLRAEQKPWKVKMALSNAGSLAWVQFFCQSNRPSVHFIIFFFPCSRSQGSAGSSPSCHRVKAEWHPGQVAGSSNGDKPRQTFHSHIHTYRQWRVSNSSYIHVCGQRESTGEPEENPHIA